MSSESRPFGKQRTTSLRERTSMADNGSSSGVARAVRGRNGANHDPAPVKRIKSFIDLWLGEQLRMRRKALRKSLQEVAQGCDISVSLLSQLERGLRSASIQTLNALARELDTPIEAFLNNLNVNGDHNEDGLDAVVRAGQHRRVDASRSAGIHKEVLTPPMVAEGNLQLYKALIEPGGSTGDTFFTTFKGHQVGYIIEGVLEL